MIDQKTVERIYDIVEATILYKSVKDHYYSLVEELGELSEAMKVHEGVFGTDHKVMKEPVTGEVADLFICGVIITCFGAKIEERLVDPSLNPYSNGVPLDTPSNRFMDHWRSECFAVGVDSGFKHILLLTQCVERIGWSIEMDRGSTLDDDVLKLKHYAIELCWRCAILFKKLKTPEDELDVIVNQKLDKWEVNQTRELEKLSNEQSND